MGGDVEPARVEVEADCRSRRLAENLLAVDRIIAFEDAFLRLLAGGGDGGRQRHQVRAQFGKHPRDLPRGRPRLVFIQQGVVRRFLVADRLGLLLFQVHDFGQPGPESLEIVRLPGFLPNLLGAGGGPRQGLDQRGGHLDGAVVNPANFPDVDRGIRLGFLEQRRIFHSSEQLAHDRRRQHVVSQPGYQGHLLRPVRRTSMRHVGPLIPGQDGAD